jgi:hypothetical protein
MNFTSSSFLNTLNSNSPWVEVKVILSLMTFRKKKNLGVPLPFLTLNENYENFNLKKTNHLQSKNQHLQ